MTEPILGLSCAGGGAHGAYQVGVLKYIHEHFSDGHKSPFRIFSGASCGSLNTSFFAAQSFDAKKSALWLEELWLSFHVPAYHGNILKNIFKSLYKQWKHRHTLETPWAGLLDPAPMRAVLDKGFIRKHLEKSIHEKSTLGIAIAATEIISGRTCWFQEGSHAKEWSLFHSIGMIEKIHQAHVAASCSVPVFLPPVKIGERYFLDGSINLTKPLSAAIIMGATKILSIATDKENPSGLPKYRADFKPRLTSVIRLLLNQLSHDAASDEADEMDAFNRFHQGLSRRHRRHDKDSESLPLFDENAKPSDYHQVEIFRLFPSKRIRALSGIEESSMGSHKRTRFMFHETFIRELIQLGYEDAKAQNENLKKFFLPQSRRKNWFFRSSGSQAA